MLRFVRMIVLLAVLGFGGMGAREYITNEQTAKAERLGQLFLFTGFATFLLTASVEAERQELEREDAAPPVPARPPLKAEYTLRGEVFTVQKEDGRIYVTHPQWSLLGIGATREAAITDLQRNIRDLARTLDAGTNVSPEYDRMRTWVRAYTSHVAEK